LRGHATPDPGEMERLFLGLGVSHESVVAGARNNRFLRLVERVIPKLAA
jgi:hypothetical protein